MKYFLVLGMLGLFFSACSQKVQIKALEPAQIDRIADTKKITVANFKNDKVGLSNKIEANLARFEIDDAHYFTMVSRNDFDKIIAEQRLQNSGLVDPRTATKVGQLIGTEAIISGNVGSPTSQDSYFYEKRVRCANKKCDKLTYYSVRCKKRVVGLSAEIRVVDVEKGDIIFADTLLKEARYKQCTDSSRSMPSVALSAQRLATQMAGEFSYKLTPHYRYFKVSLLEDPDLDYDDNQEKLLDIALEYIKQQRYTKAESLLIRLVDATASKSYVPFYNLGVLSEARGKYADAKEYYSYADNLMIEPIEEINEAVLRIDKLIAKREKTRKQIAR
jgi:tetratricopeptide (TPR) repeat protein